MRVHRNDVAIAAIVLFVLWAIAQATAGETKLDQQQYVPVTCCEAPTGG